VFDCELDEVQIDLASWTDRYNDIFTMDPEERPTLEVIADDHNLDVYLEDLVRRRQRKKK